MRKARICPERCRSAWKLGANALISPQAAKQIAKEMVPNARFRFGIGLLYGFRMHGPGEQNIVFQVNVKMWIELEFLKAAYQCPITDTRILTIVELLGDPADFRKCFARGLVQPDRDRVIAFLTANGCERKLPRAAVINAKYFEDPYSGKRVGRHFGSGNILEKASEQIEYLQIQAAMLPMRAKDAAGFIACSGTPATRFSRRSRRRPRPPKPATCLAARQ